MQRPIIPPSAPEASAPIPLLLRLLSAVVGMVVFLVGFMASFGGIIAAPFGMWLVRRWTRRRGLQLTRVASLVGAVWSSVVLAAVLWSLFLALTPRAMDKEVETAVAQERHREPLRLPGWYTRAFPQSAQFDSAGRQMVRSPSFTRVVLVGGAVLLALFFGIVGGTLGWCGATLLSWAWSGRRAA